MEIGKRKRRRSMEQLLIDDGSINSTISMHKERFKVAISVIKSIFFNPIIFMTILGILGNIVFNHAVPVYLGGTLKVKKI